MTETVDAVVIGMGPGGEEVAGRLASAGLDVIGIDANLLGGECPYWGCIPSKMMIRSANALAEVNRLSQVGGKATVEPDWSLVARRIRNEATDNWDDRVAVERFEAKGGRFVRGRAKLIGPDTVEVEGRQFVARRAIVLNVGSVPVVPPIEGLAGTPYWTNRAAIEVETLPASLVVLGGGAIGAELAQVFARFGVKVTVLEGGPRLLANEEPESGELIGKVFQKQGIRVVTGQRATRVDYSGSSFEVTTDAGETLTGDRLLLAVGRRVELHGLGLEHLEVDVDARALKVDDFLRVAPKVWAVGDVTGKGAFTHVSMYQAAIVAADILDQSPVAASYDALPRVTFTDPEVGSVGLTEKLAREQFDDIRIGYTDLSSSSRGFVHGPGNEGFVKLVVDGARGILVGATCVGPAGGEILGMLALAVHERTKVDSMRHMIYAYPTFHRAVESALADLDGKKT